MVVQTIVRSLPDMANILALLLIVMFIFAIIGVRFKCVYPLSCPIPDAMCGCLQVDLFGRASPEDFGSLGISLYSLFVLMTQDGWMSIFYVRS